MRAKSLAQRSDRDKPHDHVCESFEDCGSAGSGPGRRRRDRLSTGSREASLRYMRVWAPALLALVCVSRGVLAHDEEIEAEAEDASEAQPLPSVKAERRTPSAAGMSTC